MVSNFKLIAASCLTLASFTLAACGEKAPAPQSVEKTAAPAAPTANPDVAVAVTGIAGPDGGTEEKPVGLVYIGCSVKGEVTVKEYHFSGTRSQIR